MNLVDFSYWWDSLNAILALVANCLFFFVYNHIRRSYLVLRKFGMLMMVSAACLGMTVLFSAVIGVRDELSASIHVWRILIFGNSFFTTIGIVAAMFAVIILPSALRNLAMRK
jgi:hypothetical protein